MSLLDNEKNLTAINDLIKLDGQLFEFYMILFSKLNSIVITCLVLVGLVGNSILLITLLKSNKNLPKIACKNYLILLTIVNTLYLIIHWLTNTQSHIAYNFHLFHSFDVFDNNILACKSFGYLKNLCRFLSVILTAIFSVERFLVIYFPLKLINLRKHFIKISGLDVLLVFLMSVLVTLYVFLLLDTIPTNKNMIEFGDVKTDFPKFSLKPSTTKTYCSVSKTNQELFYNIYRFNLLIIILAYCIISTSLILLVKKLKQNQKCLIVYRPSLKLTSNKSEQNETKTNYDSKQSDAFIPRATVETTNAIEQIRQLNDVNEETPKMNETKTPNRYLSATLSSSYSTNKFQNSKMLIIIAACFLASSLPYYVGVFVSSILLKDKSSNKLSRSYWTLILRVHGFLNLAEILKCGNYSLTGLLFICSGKIFRLHFKQMIISLFRIKS